MIAESKYKLSLPALNDTNLLTIGGVDALNVTLPALTWSADVKVTGNLSEYVMPVDNLSYQALDCQV